jgi:hypothetical protein
MIRRNLFLVRFEIVCQALFVEECIEIVDDTLFPYVRVVVDWIRSALIFASKWVYWIE